MFNMSTTDWGWSNVSRNWTERTQIHFMAARNWPKSVIFGLRLSKIDSSKRHLVKFRPKLVRFQLKRTKIYQYLSNITTSWPVLISSSGINQHWLNSSKKRPTFVQFHPKCWKIEPITRNAKKSVKKWLKLN